MPGKPPGPLVIGVLGAIGEQGPMTSADLSLYLGKPKGDISSTVSRLNRAHKTVGKRLQVVGYVYDAEGSDIKVPRALYDIGDGPDAPKPKRDHKAVMRRFRARKKLRLTSVFDLGKTVRQLLSTNP